MVGTSVWHGDFIPESWYWIWADSRGSAVSFLAWVLTVSRDDVVMTQNPIQMAGEGASVPP